MKNKNLALGRNIFVSGIGASPVLADGEKSSASGNGWVTLPIGENELAVDLSCVCAVSSIELGFLHDRMGGTVCPESVSFLLSEDGVTFYRVATVDAPYPASFAMSVRADYTARLDAVYRARYVRVLFSADTDVRCDELSVLGDVCDGSEIAPDGSPYCRKTKNILATSTALTDLIRVSVGDTSIAKKLVVSDILGVEKRLSASAVVLECERVTEPTLSDYELLLDRLFSRDNSLVDLDFAVAGIKKEFDLAPDFRLGVLLSAPAPMVSLMPFGDLNGDGIEEKLLCTDDCVGAFRWFVDGAVRRFNALGFENITFLGCTYFRDTLTRLTRDDELEFAKKCSDMLHSRSLLSVFMAKTDSAGLDRLDEVGFDVTTAAVGSDVAEYLDICKRYSCGLNLDLRQLSRESVVALYDVGNTVRVFDYFGEADLSEQLYPFIYGGKPVQVSPESEAVETPSEETVEEVVREAIELSEQEVAETVPEPKTESEPEIEEVASEPEPESSVELEIEPVTEESKSDSDMTFELELDPNSPENASRDSKIELALKIDINCNRPTPEPTNDPVNEPVDKAEDVVNEPNEHRIETSERCKNSSHRSLALLGAGIATLGALYLIIKSAKGK